MPSFPLQHRHFLSLARLCCFLVFAAAAILLPHNTGAWPRDTTVNIQTHANATDLQYWWTVKCTRAELYVNGQTILGTISERRTNGCKAEWLDVPTNTAFTYKIFGAIVMDGVTKEERSGSRSSNGVGPQKVGHTAVLPEIYLSK